MAVSNSTASRARGATPRVAIIGSGFSGLCLAIRLKQSGIESFTILEKAKRLGGTWRENTYPGCACDLMSFAYCFSFEQKTDWSRKWSPQSEILEYLEHCARKYELLSHIRFDTEVAAARFDDEQGVWRIRTASGEEIRAEILVSAVGQLNLPFVPAFPGLEKFRGECFHSARWDAGFEAEGKDVAVIGNAASAIQFVPELAKRAGRLHIFQRSPNWMLPRRDRPYSEAEKRRFARHPALARLYRWWIWLSFELRFPVFRRNRFFGRRIEALARSSMQSQISDPALRRALVPDYPIGGKRILISDDYYPCLERDNVEVVTSGIDHITADAIVTRDGHSHRVDALILATGFDSTSFLAPMAIEGPGGRSLESQWKDGAVAYLGLAIAGFPNFFLMYGPNTNLGHNSIIFMIECQSHYILECLHQMDALGLATVELRQEVMDAYNRKLQHQLGRSVWAATSRSWYKTADGKITNNWSGTTARYWWQTRRADLGAYHQRPQRARSPQ
jgi:cation diffusion facilitator CzcD-associated flavoprotein CzcO